jgi:hypothetical protein
MEDYMNSFSKRLENLQRVREAAKDPDMKRIWHIKELQLINQRKEKAHERLQDQARMVH